MKLDKIKEICKITYNKKYHLPREEAALRQRCLAPVASEASRMKVDIVGDAENLRE